MSRPSVGTRGIGLHEPWLMPWLKSAWHRFWQGSNADPLDLTEMRANRQIQFVGDMQRLELRPGDILVLRYDGHISKATAETLRESMESRFAGHKVVVLADGLKLGVVGAGCSTQLDEPPKSDVN